MVITDDEWIKYKPHGTGWKLNSAWTNTEQTHQEHGVIFTRPISWEPRFSGFDDVDEFDECGKCFADGRLNGETSRVECSRCHRMNIASGRMDEMEIRTFTCQRCSDELKR